MHSTLEEIQKRLVQIINQVKSVMPNDDPLGNAHNNWSFPGLTKTELVEEAQSIIDLIEESGADDLGEHDARLKDYLRRLQHLQKQTVPQIWNNAQAVSAYILTLDGLRKALKPVLTRDWFAETLATQKTLAAKVRGMDARIKDLEPRTAPLAMMVERIEKAYNAADQLPTDLESLAEAREKILGLLKEAQLDKASIVSIREQAKDLDKQLNQSADDAEKVIARCENAYSAATSVGLAAAFSERSAALSYSMWTWVIGLILALVAGSFFGTMRLHALTELTNLPNPSTSMIVLNLLLSLLSVGAPVWFAWLATKQIGQRFRLAEDYAYKASISRAYEGFRREAARVDEDMEAQLLASALTRLDELPLRLVETDNHGSPWHELASSDLVKQAMKVVPGFTEQMKALASDALRGFTASKTKSSTVPPEVNTN